LLELDAVQAKAVRWLEESRCRVGAAHRKFKGEDLGVSFFLRRRFDSALLVALNQLRFRYHEGTRTKLVVLKSIDKWVCWLEQ
jgi:hypothetical protein